MALSLVVFIRHFPDMWSVEDLDPRIDHAGETLESSPAFCPGAEGFLTGTEAAEGVQAMIAAVKSLRAVVGRWETYRCCRCNAPMRQGGMGHLLPMRSTARVRSQPRLSRLSMRVLASRGHDCVTHIGLVR